MKATKNANSNRSRRYNRISNLPEEVLLLIAEYLKSEGIQPTKGELTSNYYNSNYTNNPPGKRGIRYELENSPTRPLTERTKKLFSDAQKQRGMNVARIHKEDAAHRFLYHLYGSNKFGAAGGSPARGSPVAIRRHVNPSNSPIYNSNNNSNNAEPIGGHMHLYANFKTGPSKVPRGTKNNFMRTSKSVRAALRPGPTKGKNRFGRKFISTRTGI